MSDRRLNVALSALEGSDPVAAMLLRDELANQRAQIEALTAGRADTFVTSLLTKAVGTAAAIGADSAAAGRSAEAATASLAVSIGKLETVVERVEAILSATGSQAHLERLEALRLADARNKRTIALLSAAIPLAIAVTTAIIHWLDGPAAAVP